MIVLDTNVISALMRPEANAPIVDWVDAKRASDLWTTAVSLMEIRTGLLLMPFGKRQEMLTSGFDRLLGGLLKGRLLPFDASSAEHASNVALTQQRRGNNVGIGDIQIAGIALANGAILATRNMKDFHDLDIPLVDPWAVSSD
jgi:predicted nucleic acid-binding protein